MKSIGRNVKCEQGGEHTLESLEDSEKPWIFFPLEKFPGKP